jgi:hypothetical protein
MQVIGSHCNTYGVNSRNSVFFTFLPMLTRTLPVRANAANASLELSIGSIGGNLLVSMIANLAIMLP